MGVLAALVKAGAATARVGVHSYATKAAPTKAVKGRNGDDGPAKCTPCAAVRRKASGYAAANRAFGRGE